MTRLLPPAAGAGPEDLRAALKDLAVASEGKTRRTWAVLGAMPGQDREGHMDLGRFLVRLDLTRLLAVGTEAGAVHAGAVLEGSWGHESIHVPDAATALALLAEQLTPDDVVLVAGVGVEAVRNALGTGAPS